MNNEVINWLLEDDNPSVKYRTLTELLNQQADISDSKKWITSRLPENWYETNGLWYRYYITALAECGLSYKELPAEYIHKAFDELDKAFVCNCGDFMLLRALVKLGCYDNQIIKAS